MEKTYASASGSFSQETKAKGRGVFTPWKGQERLPQEGTFVQVFSVYRLTGDEGQEGQR